MTLNSNRPLLKSLIVGTGATALCSVPGGATTAPAEDSTIRVDATRVMNHVSKWMYGSCIEDVNHEIYGGLYAQRIFGESFEEPPQSLSPLAGWTAFGGQWSAGDGTISVLPDAGGKLVRDAPDIREATIDCDVRLADDKAGNAGLILRVRSARTGADTWTGYEISISAHDQTVILGRHNDNWLLLKSAAAPIEAGKWHRLRVKLAGPTITVYLDDNAEPVISYSDEPGNVIRSGRIGLRTWNTSASFRRMRIETPQRSFPEGFDRTAAGSAAAVSGMWDAMQTGNAVGHYGWDSVDPYNSQRSQRIEHAGGTGAVGVVNRGLNRWGISVRSGRAYSGRIYVRSSGSPGAVTVALQSADGSRTYASEVLSPPTAEWSRRDFSLRSDGYDANARFAVWIERPGTVWLDQVYLSGTGDDVYHGLPVRADIGRKLGDEGVAFLRYGGSMVNAPEYRWKQMIGPPDLRPQYNGTWYPHSTNGFGIVEFLRFCEAAKIEPAFAINIEETPEDAADLVEYLNGGPATAWGKRRSEDGHPKPFNVRYIEIGNEEAISGDRAQYSHYLERFKILEKAMHSKDPDLQLVIAAWWRPEEPLVKKIVKDLSGKAALWDVHVGGDDLREGANVDRLFTEMKRLFEEWAPGTTLKACVYEENGGQHNLRRALGHAHILNVTQRHGDFVLMDCPANCLQPFGQNDNGWDQGQIFFTPDTVWGMPPFYVQRMASMNHLPLRVYSDQSSPDDDLDVTASRSDDGGVVVLKVVNVGDVSHTTVIDLQGSMHVRPDADSWTLSGTDLGAINTATEPERITMRHSMFAGASARFTYVFPAYSYTVLRLRRGQQR